MYQGDDCARVGSPAGRLRSSGENDGLDGDVESFVELSWLGLGHQGQLEFYPVQPCGGHDEQSYRVSDRVYLPYRASCSFTSALPFVGETSQQRQGACRAEEMGR
ncbi:hypothetical protein Taro_030297 [Colocasia esculenta]|uniref:Uncharacterized protein n=1 Tax=Colocasia esculenta TaxID=4460 RepID=A0A843VTP7_COLES|nr:hypothetical protein [Colocasia esculenta]